MCKVSVLVAVYNAEKSISQCLDSLLGQTLRDIQIICVDDCSQDSSLGILKRYASMDRRVEVIHLDENSGIAHARNVGLEKAKGEYVCFLDSDDWMSADALEKAVDVFERYDRTDSVLFRVVLVYGDHEEEYDMDAFDVMDGKKAFMESLSWKIHGVYIVRADIHRRYRYDETSRTYSDENVTRIHYYNSREVRSCEGIYYYRQNADSVTHKVSVSRFDSLAANESMKEQLCQMGADNDILDTFENIRWLKVVDSYMFYYKNRNKLKPSERKYGLSEIRRVWRNIECSRLVKVGKFGYMPLRWSWTAFRIQEEIYFLVRKIIRGL